MTTEQTKQYRWLTDAELKNALQPLRPFLDEAKRIAVIADKDDRFKQSRDFRERIGAFRRENQEVQEAWNQGRAFFMLNAVVGTLHKDAEVNKNLAYLILENYNADAAMAIKKAIEITGVERPTSIRDLNRPRKEGEVNEYVSSLVTALKAKGGSQIASGLDDILNHVGSSEADRLIPELNRWLKREGKHGNYEERQAFYKNRRNKKGRSKTFDEATHEAAHEPSKHEQLESEIATLEAKKAEASAKEDYDAAGKLKAQIAEKRAALEALGDENDDAEREQLLSEIKELEAKKAEASAKEDYDAAGKLKAQIAEKRAALEAMGKPPTTTNGAAAQSKNSGNGSILASVLTKLGGITEEEQKLVIAYVATSSPATKGVVDLFLADKMTSVRFLQRVKNMKPSQGTASAATSASANA